MSYKPDSYNSASPYLLVPDAEASLAFVAAAFDAPPLRVIRRDDGSIEHAEARVDDTVVMFGEMPGAAGAHVHVYVEDVDASMGKVLDAGGTLVQSAMEKGDGDRRGGVLGPDGTTWWISTQLTQP